MKKLISLLMTLIISVSCFNMAFAGELDYVALGDSIARGYGLASVEQAYPNIFANKKQLNLINLGVDGMTSQELLDFIATNEDISTAGIITVSIGSNDLLQPLIEILANEIGLDLTTVGDDVYADIQNKIIEIYDNGNGTKKLESIFNSLTKTLRNNPTLIAAADNFVNNTFSAVISAIREKNPNAQIFVTDIYNPYKNVTVSIKLSANSSAYVNLGDMCQTYVDRINKAFNNPQDYTLITISEIFESRVLTNVTRDIWIEALSSCSLDPHPDYAGHALIATLVANAYVSEFVYGDANSDGSVEANDSAKILQYVLNSKAVDMSDEELIKSDVTGDGAITAQDSSWVLQRVLKSTFKFNVE